MLSGLAKGLVSAKAVAEAVRAYHQEMNRRNHERRAQTDADGLAIPKIERSINGIMTAIEDGMYAITDRFGCRWGVLAMNWKETIEAISAHATFSAPVEERTLIAAETQLGMRLPQSLRELLAESNGVRGEYDLALIWPVERIVADNRSFRESTSFRALYMPFEGLLFFADAGNGDQFAFAVAGGQVRRSDIFVWNHEDDSRTWLAKDLREYLEGWISGRITI